MSLTHECNNANHDLQNVKNYDSQTHKHTLHSVCTLIKWTLWRPKRLDTLFRMVTLKTTKRIEVHHFNRNATLNVVYGAMDNLSFWDA